MKTKRTILSLAAALLSLFALAFATTAHAQLASGLSLNFDAADPASGIDSANWNSLTANATQDFDFGGDVTLESVSSSGSSITSAYRFTGGTGDNNNPTWNGLFGEGDATSWEFWLKPDDTGDANQTIYESGGSGTGYSIWYAKGTDADGMGTINFTTDGGGGAQIETVRAVIDTSDFRQITLIYDESAGGGSIDLLEIYVDGVLVDDNLSVTTSDDASNDNDNTTINDYCGGDGTGLGNTNNSLANGASDGEFDGDIAVFRVWGGIALTPADVANNYSVLAGPDTTPPSIASLSPPHDSTAVYPGTNLVATFSEDIQALTGNLTITNLDTTTDTLIAIDDTTQVTVSGNALIVDPAANLLFDTSYAVQIDSGAIGDVAATPNLFPGILDTTTWNFTTAAQDLTAPLITATVPVDDAINIIPNDPLVAIFDENLVLGTGDIRINGDIDNSSVFTTLQTIDVTDASQVSITDNVLTITPATILTPAIELAVQIDAGAVRNFTDVGFAGISDNTTWSFTTASVTTYTGPNTTNNDRWNDAANWDIAVPVGALDVIVPAGKIATAWSDATPAYTGDLSIGDGATVQIGWTTNRPNSFNALGTPGDTTITMGAGSLIKSRTSASPVIPAIQLTGDARIRLGESTQTPASPTFNHPVTGAHPFTIESNASGPTVGLNVANSFSSLTINAIGGRGGNHGTVIANAAGALGTGDVSVTTSDGNKTLKLEFDVANAMAATGTLNINGGGPSGNGTGRVRMDANNTIDALTLDGFPYPAGTYGRAGTPAPVDYEVAWIEGNSVLTVSTNGVDTGGTNPMPVSFSPPHDTTDAFVADCFEITFDEPVIAGSGNILVKNLSDTTTTVIPVTSSEVEIVDFFKVRIDPAANLAGGKDYAIQVAPTAITDIFGNAYAGISDDTTWNFTTVDPKTLLFEDFESPDVSDADSDGFTSGAVPPGWVGATQGFGASRRGIVDESHGDFTDTTGEQAFAFRYTNSGLTSAEGEIGKLVLGATYTVSFDHVLDGHNNGQPWRAKLIVVEDGARRDDIRNNSGTTVLREVSGTISSSAYTTVSFDFTPNAIDHADSLFKDVAIRFIGATTSATIDNVEVSVASETIPPTVVSIADNVGGGPVTVPTPIVYTVSFDESINSATIGTGDFENGSTAGITVNSVNATGSPGVYEVAVTTTSAGDLVLQIKAGAVIEDAVGNALDTTSAIPDDTTITVEGPTGDYEIWAAMFPGFDLSDPNADLDGDGLTNDEERRFGLDPTDPSSVNPYPTGLFDDPGFTFSYTRRDDALTGLNYTIWTASDAKMWMEDTGAVQVVGDPATTLNNMVETIEVTLSPGLLANPILHARVQTGDFPALLSENFDADDGGFTVSTTVGTEWEHGDPDSSGLGGTVNGGNGGSAGAWGTNLGDIMGTTADNGYYDDSTITCLRSAIIDLTSVAGAELTFAEALDLYQAGASSDPDDTAVVNIIDDTTDAIIAAAVYTAVDASDSSADWEIANGGTPIDLTPYVGQAIRIEWCFTGFGGDTDDYMGWYVDDVIVKQTAGP